MIAKRGRIDEGGGSDDGEEGKEVRPNELLLRTRASPPKSAGPPAPLYLLPAGSVLSTSATCVGARRVEGRVEGKERKGSERCVGLRS